MPISSSLVGRPSAPRRRAFASTSPSSLSSMSVRRGASVLVALAASSSSSMAFAPPRTFGVVAPPPIRTSAATTAAPHDPLETTLPYHRTLVEQRPPWSSLSMVTSPPEVDPSSSSSLRRAAVKPSSLNRGKRGHIISSASAAAAESASDDESEGESDAPPPRRRRRRKKYQRKRQMPETERRQERMRRDRQEKYDRVRRREGGEPPSIWNFEALFPAPVWDEASIQRDLYEVGERDGKTFINRLNEQQQQEQGPGNNGEGQMMADSPVAGGGGGIANKSGPFAPKIDEAVAEKMKKIQSAGLAGAPSELKVWREPGLRNNTAIAAPEESDAVTDAAKRAMPPKPDSVSLRNERERKIKAKDTISWGVDARAEALAAMNATGGSVNQTFIDPALTRMVEDRLYGFRRTALGDFQYDTSLMGDGAVQFRDGVRLGNPLKVNADLLNFHAKKDLSHGKVEEAEELYERALTIDPRDGRAYLGLGRIAQRRRDFAKARECLRAGIANSVDLPRDGPGGTVLVDLGANPFLLQALGCLEERVGSLAEAEALFVAATRSRPSHAASWVSLAQLRTRKLRMGAAAGRACYRAAERELRAAGLKPSAYVYTAWASMEHKKGGDVRRARELFEMALEVDPRCSAAWLQLGVMEGVGRENWERAKECFESALKFDKKNSRILQAYAIMESRRPDGDSREAIGLFERALKAKPRDAGVLQAYALYVAKLGDIDAARDLLQRGAMVDKRHAAVWQAWGVLETQHGTAQTARDVFQQGIWACAQSGGGQSGGRRCARLWQAWGVLESREGDHAAARRCFSRALDADKRNVAAVTAWTLMEEDLGRFADARSIFERALRQLPPSSEEKMAVWRAYELMEQTAGEQDAAQRVYQRSMRETFAITDDFIPEFVPPKQVQNPADDESILNMSREVEVVRWNTRGGMGGGGEVWMKDGNIEGKVPASAMKKSNNKRNAQKQSDGKP